jgi:hypothetical protein
MASDYARRGRPRGSGLDDRTELRRITEMLQADPTLRPTTAIKAIGVSDPSSIRRLREKLKSLPENPGPSDRETHPAERPAPAFAASVANDAANGAGQTAVAAEASSPDAWIAQWCALGLHAMSSTMQAHMTLMTDLFHIPQVESALRQQLLFNEVAKAFCPKRPDVRSIH